MSSYSSAYEDIVRTVAEAKEATEAAQDSAQKVQAYLQLDEDMNIERISKKSFEKSRKIEEESRDLFEKRGNDHFEVMGLY